MFAFAAFVGCSPSSPGPPPNPIPRQALACRIVATTTDDPALVVAAQSQSDRLVAQDGRTIGEWVPIADASKAGINQVALQSAVTRQTKNCTEILLSHSHNDIIGTHVSHMNTGTTDHLGQSIISLRLTDLGSKCASQLTHENALRLLAIVVGGEVVVVAKLESPLWESFTIRSKTVAESNRIAGILRRQ